MTKLQTELKGVTERFNAAIKESGYFIEIGHRNNYTAIDVCYQSTGAMKDYLDAGMTDRQCLNTLYNMCKAVELINNPAKK